MKPILAVLCLVAVQPVIAGDELSLRWSEVPQSRIVGRKVELRLADNAVVHGRATALTTDGIRLTVTGSRGAAAQFSKGEAVIPASRITTIKVNRNGILGRIIGTSVLTGLTVGALLSGDAGRPTAGGAAVIVAMPAAGYGIGWLIDRESLLLRIVP